MLANLVLGPAYLTFWHEYNAGLSIEHWINNALMAICFLLVALELIASLVAGLLGFIWLKL